MTDERLKEIKDSIDLQLELAKQLNIDDELVLEEKELYDYAELLKERISYLERSIVRKEEIIAELEQERVPYTNEYVEKVNKENQELKKQLKEYKYSHPCSFVDTCQTVKIANYEQQQEFIKCLEDEIKACKAVSDLLFNSNKEIKVYKEILQKYKEIVGVLDEKNND